VNAGFRDFVAIAIYVDSDKLFPPCGACRQVLAEFNPAMEVLYANRAQICRSNLESLLSQAFTLKS